MPPSTARGLRSLALRLRLGRLRKTYWIVCPKATSVLPKITMFREWLLAQAADDMRRLKTLRS
jgi:hypothetical protein